MKTYVLFIVVALSSGRCIAQTGGERTIVDNGNKFQYTDSMGTTSSFIYKFGDSLDIPPMTAMDGKTIEAVDLRGKTVVLNFWFTSCKPCVAEMPVLNRLSAAFRNDPIVFVGITFDNKEKVEKFLASKPFDFNIARLPLDEIQKLKKVSLFPATFIMDKHQRLTFVIFGRQPKENDDAAFYDVLYSRVKNTMLR